MSPQRRHRPPQPRDPWVLTKPPNWLRIDLPTGLQVLGRLRLAGGRARPGHARCGSTPVSRSRRRCTAVCQYDPWARGKECDHVVVAHYSATPLPDTEDARQLPYVALSRARRSVWILLSARAPSPLLPSDH